MRSLRAIIGPNTTRFGRWHQLGLSSERPPTRYSTGDFAGGTGKKRQ
jgi:hypothetical protein